MKTDTTPLRVLAHRLDAMAGHMADAGKFSILVNESADLIDVIEQRVEEHARTAEQARTEADTRLLDHELQITKLDAALREMIRAYVNLMETGRDRIIDLGGQCDPVDVMEAKDPALKAARAAMAGWAKARDTANVRRPQETSQGTCTQGPDMQGMIGWMRHRQGWPSVIMTGQMAGQIADMLARAQEPA